MINLIVLLMSLLFVSIAKAKIIVALQDRPPQLSINNGEFSGPIYEIAKKLVQGINEDLHFQPVLWSRALRLAELNEDLLLIRHSMTDSRQNFLLPIIYGFEKRKVHFYKNKDSNFNIKSIEDLKKYKIGYRRASFYFPEFQNFDKRNLHALDTDEQLLKMVANKRVDLVIFNDHAIYKEKLERLNDPRLKNSITPINFFYSFTNPRFFSVPKGSNLSKKFYTDLNCTMLMLRKSGLIKSIFEKYHITPPFQMYNDKYSKAQISLCN